MAIAERGAWNADGPVSETGGTANLTTTSVGRPRKCYNPLAGLGHMQVTRTAAYVGGGALLVAWFAAASAPMREQMPPRDAPRETAATSGTDSLAGEIQSQAARLRDRLAQAPAPDLHQRNPFRFAPVPAAQPSGGATARSTPSSGPPPLPVELPPALTLMGIAEDQTPIGLHRTAVIGGMGDAVYVVMEGQAVADRYRVTTIGQDAVELKDLATGGYRRLALR
jgi:hypothetical protein